MTLEAWKLQSKTQKTETGGGGLFNTELRVIIYFFNSHNIFLYKIEIETKKVVFFHIYYLRLNVQI